MQPYLAVLITVHNRKYKTLNCIEHLNNAIKYLNENIDVYITDDKSVDGTKEAVFERYPFVKIINGDGNLFWNRGMHKAWLEALKGDYEYYLWLNDDSFLFENSIQIMVNTSKKYSDLAIICGATCSDETKSVYTYGGKLINGDLVIPNKSDQDLDVMNGNVVLVSNLICKSIGILNPIFPHAIGDHEYGLRAKNAGFRIIMPGEYLAVCEEKANLPEWCYQNVPLFKRFKSLYSPLGSAHPKYFFIYEKEYFGLFNAVKHYLLIHVRVLFPFLWKK